MSYMTPVSGMVLTAAIGPNVARHLVLGDRTACEQPVSSTWQVGMGTPDSVGCPTCRERAAPRDEQAGSKGLPATGPGIPQDAVAPVCSSGGAR